MLVVTLLEIQLGLDVGGYIVRVQLGLDNGGDTVRDPVRLRWWW